jgi:signal transduction histidine kinase
MVKLKVKLSLYNLFSKLAFTVLFIVFMPFIFERINLRQVDNDLINKREDVIRMISEIGIEPFVESDSTGVFGSFDILKEEFISLEKVNLEEDLNFIEVSVRKIDNEEITYRIINYTFKIDGQQYLLEVGKSLSSIHRTQADIYRVLLVLLIIIIAATFLTDLQYNNYLLRPLDRITGKLTNISTPSMFDKTLVNTKTTDFVKLDESLVGLMEHIEVLFRKEKDITANISHELLTPISIMRSKLENLLLTEGIGEKAGSKIEESLKTLYRLQTLVNSLLFIARIESHQYLRIETFTVGSVLEEVCDEIKPIAEDKEVTLKLDADQDLEMHDANRSLLFSMFYNVVNNAVKNTPGGGTVTVRSSLGNSSKHIVEVTDTGKGMTQDQIKNLFSRFKTTVDRRDDGHGIGLAIAKTIADFHEIGLQVISEKEKGSTFFFTFFKSS